MASLNLLDQPPGPAPGPEVPAQQSQYLTPPPSPHHASSPQNFEQWGLLKPLNTHSPYLNWFFFRNQKHYTIGDSAKEGADHVARWLSTTPFCALTWDGTDNPGSVKITSGGCMNDMQRQPRYGTYYNNCLLEDGETCVLRHGDMIDLYWLPDGWRERPEEELKFVLLQCTSKGWLPLQYAQYTFASHRT